MWRCLTPGSEWLADGKLTGEAVVSGMVTGCASASTSPGRRLKQRLDITQRLATGRAKLDATRGREKPASLDEAQPVEEHIYFEELVSERRVPYKRMGVTVFRWEKPDRAANEMHDTFLYASAAAIKYGVNWISDQAWVRLRAELETPPARSSVQADHAKHGVRVDLGITTVPAVRALGPAPLTAGIDVLQT